MALNENIIELLLTPKSSSYTIENTLTYSILLILASYVVFKLLRKFGIKIDRSLAVAVSPYIIFGAALRVLKDAGFVTSYIFQTPGIYLLVFAVTFGSMILSLLIKRKFNVPYYKTTFLIGVLLIPFVLAHLQAVNIYGGALVTLFFLPWIVVSKFAKWSMPNKIVTLLHLFDATTTAVSMNYFGYAEQHVLPTFLINIFGPFSFIFFKLIAIVSILLIIDRFADTDTKEDREFILYIKLIIGILGAATGSRDFITLVAGV